MAVIDLPIGVGLYLAGGWLLVIVQCVAFVVAAFVIVAWGACREVTGETPPRVVWTLFRAWRGARG